MAIRTSTQTTAGLPSNNLARPYYRRLPRNFLTLLLLLACSVGIQPREARAQSPANDPQRKLIDQLLETLIKSELDRRDGLQPASFTETNITQPRVDSLTNNLYKIRRSLTDFADGMSRLTSLLTGEVNRSPGVRGLINDALQIRAAAAVLAQKAARENDIRRLIAEFEPVDRNWRVLAYRLEQLRELSSTTRDSIRTVNDADRTLGQLLQLQPQFDRNALMQQTAALTADLHNLLEDVEIELDRSSQREEMLLAGHRVQQQAIQMSTTLYGNTSYDAVASEYQKFRTLWYPFAARLRPFENRYLERSVRRIRAADQAMHELLWLPQTIDRQQLLHLASVLRKDVDQFFLRASLRVLITIPESQYVLSTASEFYGTVENFTDYVSGGSDQDVLVEEFRYISNSWETFNRLFRQVNSDAAIRVLDDIERSVAELRKSLQLKDNFDRQEAISLAASLENFAGHLQFDMKNWLNQRRVSFAPQALADSSEFLQLSRQLHQQLTNGASVQQLRGDVSRLYDTWQRVHGHVLKCDTREKTYLQAVSSRITPVVVDLQTRLSL